MATSSFNWQTPNKHDAIQRYCYDMLAGQLILQTQGKILCSMEWLTFPSSAKISLPLPVELQQQLKDNWLNLNPEISLPLLRQGTSFQHTVWEILRQIPVGQTKTYGELSSELNTSPRALANACRKNPFPLIIPCHRVVAKTGIGGYAGEVTGKLIEIKTALLQHEKMVHVVNRGFLITE